MKTFNEITEAVSLPDEMDKSKTKSVAEFTKILQSVSTKGATITDVKPLGDFYVITYRVGTSLTFSKSDMKRISKIDLTTLTFNNGSIDLMV